MDELEQLRAENDTLRRICDETYQVVGVLATEAGRFDDEDVQNVLDNLVEQRIVHEDVLPFESKKVSG